MQKWDIRFSIREACVLHTPCCFVYTILEMPQKFSAYAPDICLMIHDHIQLGYFVSQCNYLYICLLTAHLLVDEEFCESGDGDVSPPADPEIVITLLSDKEKNCNFCTSVKLNTSFLLYTEET